MGFVYLFLLWEGGVATSPPQQPDLLQTQSFSENHLLWETTTGCKHHTLQTPDFAVVQQEWQTENYVLSVLLKIFRPYFWFVNDVAPCHPGILILAPGRKNYRLPNHLGQSLPPVLAWTRVWLLQFLPDV